MSNDNPFVAGLRLNAGKLAKELRVLSDPGGDSESAYIDCLRIFWRSEVSGPLARALASHLRDIQSGEFEDSPENP